MADAARREAIEVAGMLLPDELGPVVLQREARFEFDGEWLEQTDVGFLVRRGSYGRRECRTEYAPEAERRHR